MYIWGSLQKEGLARVRLQSRTVWVGLLNVWRTRVSSGRESWGMSSTESGRSEVRKATEGS